MLRHVDRAPPAFIPPAPTGIRDMNFCSHCGERVSLRTPEGDNVPRYICDACGTIHYQNPKMVVGCIVEWERRILLCRRAIEPRYGFWTAPAGFMERGETVEEGAAREVREEAMAQVEVGSLVAMVNVPHVDQVHLLYRARLVGGRFGAGDETLEAALYAEAEIPWDDLAFPSVRFGLERYFEDRAAGVERLHSTRVGRITR
jgi:ADP-ribose pyrophosphatase YjhB (NUDIX family)